jgi:hypothetical protein
VPGRYVPIAESIRGFKEILEGKHDEVPESAFFMKGSIDEVRGGTDSGQEDSVSEEEAEASDRAEDVADVESETTSGDE